MVSNDTTPKAAADAAMLLRVRAVQNCVVTGACGSSAAYFTENKSPGAAAGGVTFTGRTALLHAKRTAGAACCATE